MNNDYSWLGLYRKGYKLQYLTHLGWKDIGVVHIETFKMLIEFNYKFRYKHSIQ